MAAYRIGQRVRKVKLAAGVDWSHAISLGSVGVITGVGMLAPNGQSADYTVVYDLDEDRTTPCYALHWMLEPIQKLYDGNQTVEWGSCLWQPEYELDKQLGEMA